MKNKFRFLTQGLLLIMSLLTLQGCQTLKEIANLRNVDFALGALTNINLAGVRLDDIRSYNDLSPGDILKLTTGFARKDLPLSFDLTVKAQNPTDNQVAARLVRLSWTLLLEDRETISGAIEEEYVLNPGEPINIPVDISLELTEFFSNNARDLMELAASLSGAGGASKQVKLVATPVVDTIIGPIKYPEPITIVNETVGG